MTILTLISFLTALAKLFPALNGLIDRIKAESQRKNEIETLQRLEQKDSDVDAFYNDAGLFDSDPTGPCGRMRARSPKQFRNADESRSAPTNPQLPAMSGMEKENPENS